MKKTINGLHFITVCQLKNMGLGLANILFVSEINYDWRLFGFRLNLWKVSINYHAYYLVKGIFCSVYNLYYDRLIVSYMFSPSFTWNLHPLLIYQIILDYIASKNSCYTIF